MMNATKLVNNNKGGVSQPTLTYSLAKKLLTKGRQRLLYAEINKLDPPMCKTSKRCSLSTMVSVHQSELREWSGDEPIRPALARAIWFEYNDDLVFGVECRKHINSSHTKIDTHEFIMMECPEEE